MTVSEYLDGAPESQRSTLLALRANLKEILPEAEDTISYGMTTFRGTAKLVPVRIFQEPLQLFPPLGHGATRTGSGAC
jgi:uncharacterized protein YdhG (YjbR/CyaY superfamily)